MRIKYVINSKMAQKRHKNICYQRKYVHIPYSVHGDTQRSNSGSTERKTRDFYRNIVARFLLTVIHLVSVYVVCLGADFIASTNLSPNFIKAKNGIFLRMATYVCNEDRIHWHHNVAVAFSYNLSSLFLSMSFYIFLLRLSWMPDFQYNVKFYMYPHYFEPATNNEWRNTFYHLKSKIIKWNV